MLARLGRYAMLKNINMNLVSDVNRMFDIVISNH